MSSRQSAYSWQTRLQLAINDGRSVIERPSTFSDHPNASGDHMLGESKNTPYLAHDELRQSLVPWNALFDIAPLNLTSAVGLPDAETLDIPHCLRVLNQWAALVHEYSTAKFHRFRREPSSFSSQVG